jgi:CHAT domain-containing protein
MKTLHVREMQAWGALLALLLGCGNLVAGLIEVGAAVEPVHNPSKNDVSPSTENTFTNALKSQASKEAFLATARKHGYLHLATHGFFIEEKARVPALGSREVSPAGEMLHGSEAAATYPALLSGLALAGANKSGTANASETTGGNEGILTAEEIGTQNLDGVQLVVLSTCESGLGKLASGEGLLGLQRSFQSAGARTVAASLWPVDDAATETLMVAFYTNLWEKKLSKIEALRRAQLTMLREYDTKAGKLRGPGVERPVDPGKLAAAKEVGGAKTLSPFYWASFVLSGDWK